MRFTFSEVPKDVNSGLPATRAEEPSLPVRVRQKEIVILRRDKLLKNSAKAFTQGASNLPLLAFEVSNKDYADSLFVNGLRVGFYEPSVSRSIMATQTVRNLFSKIRIVNYKQFEQGQTLTNPVEVIFNLKEKLTINPDASDTLVILADTRTDAPRRAFFTILDTVNVFDVSPLIGLALTDSLGNRYDAFSGFSSDTLAVISSNVKDNIGAYPNPFGRASLGPEYEQTRIAFYLEQASDVAVRIFTLHGELVKTFEKAGVNSGLNSSIIWDGTNDKGKRVLNGVYICAIEIKPLGGGSTQRYNLKIAYIK